MRNSGRCRYRGLSPWEARTPLIFGLPFTESNRAFFEDWITLKVQFETQMSTLLGVWIFIGIVGTVIVALSGLSRWATTRRVTALSVGVLCLFILSYGAILGLLNLAHSEIAATQPGELLLLITRWGLVTLVLVMLGGVRRADQRRLPLTGVATQELAENYPRNLRN